MHIVMEMTSPRPMQYVPVADEARGLHCILATTHRAFKRVLETTANALRVCVPDVEACSVACYLLGDASRPYAEGYVVQRGPEMLAVNISTRQTLTGTKKHEKVSSAFSHLGGLSSYVANACEPPRMPLSTEDLRESSGAEECRWDSNDGAFDSEDSEPETVGPLVGGRGETDRPPVEEEGLAAAAAAAVAPGPPKPEAGFTEWDHVASSRSSCGVCRERIERGAVRLWYRFKATTSLRDHRCIHPHCAMDLPRESRARDHAKLRAMAHTGPEAVQQLLDDIADLLNPSDARGSGDAL